MSEALNSLKITQTRFNRAAEAGDRLFVNGITFNYFEHMHPRLAEAVKWRGGV